MPLQSCEGNLMEICDYNQILVTAEMSYGVVYYDFYLFGQGSMKFSSAAGRCRKEKAGKS